MDSGYSDVAVLVPCLNEEGTVGKVVDDFRRELPGCTVYVYDNRSTDGTAQVAMEHGAVVRREPRPGKGVTVRQMIRDVDAACYLMVDGDDTYPAEAARSLVDPVLDGTADQVVGDRLSNGSYAHENRRAFHGVGNDLVRTLVRLLYGHAYADVMSGYRAFSRPFAKTLPILGRGFELETELSIFAADHAWRTLEVPIDYRDRPAGSISKLDTARDGVRVLRCIASLFKDYRPLPFFGGLAVALVALGLALGVPVCLEFAATGLVRRLPTAVLAAALCGLGALMLVCGLILDSCAKASRRSWELEAIRAFEERRPMEGTVTDDPVSR